MRILQIARYGSVKGGAESYVRALCEGLRAAGHEVALAYRFDGDDTRPEVREGAVLRAITSTSVSPSQAERDEVGALLDRTSPDIVHLHNIDASWMAGACVERSPTVVAVHDHRLDCPVGTRYWAAWHRACDIHPGPVCLAYNAVAHCGSLRANVTLKPYRNWRRHQGAARTIPTIQVFSAYMAGMLQRSGIPRERVAVTPYPVPPMPGPANIDDDGSRPVVFATGRLTREKGFDVLLDALDHVSTPVRLVVAGQGHHGDALASRAGGVPERHLVRFLGWLALPELAGWYERAAIVAVPSAWPEPFGIVGLEAMAAGRPVVAADLGGIREWLEPGVTGIAVPPRDARAFGAAIEALILDPDRRAAMGGAGRERARNEFSLSRHMERIARLYDIVCTRWPGTA